MHFEAADFTDNRERQQSNVTKTSNRANDNENEVLPPIDKLFELSQVAERCESSESIDELSSNIVTILSQVENHLDSIANTFQGYHEELTVISVKQALEEDCRALKQFMNINRGKTCSSTPQAKENNNLMYVNTYVNGRKVSTLLDTGASKNYMSEEFCNSKLVKQLDAKFKPAQIKVNTADNSQMISIGIVSLPITIQRKSCVVDFVVLPKLSHSVILGLQFCTEHRVIIDTHHRTIRFAEDREHLLTLTNTTSIPAFSEIEHVEINTRHKLPKRAWISSAYAVQSRFGIFAARGLIGRKATKIQLANLSNEDVVLSAGTVVAIAVNHPNSDWEECPEFNSLLADETSNRATTHDQANSEELVIFKSEEEINAILKPLDVDVSKHDAKQLQKLASLIKEYSEIFVNDDTNLKQSPVVKHVIDTGKNLPISQAPYRTNLKTKKIINDIIQKHIENKFIEPSRSPWASPVVLVSKKDGSTRFCVDYRKLNAITKRDVYPLPRVDDALAAMQGNTYFSTFDMCAGYHQLSMHEDSKERSAFIVDSGLYQWNVMPFGLTNAGATFQRLMDAVFAGLKWKNLIVYIDDVIVFSPTFEQHEQDLREVFERMKNAKLKFKTSKCHVLQSKVKYLGHVVDKDGIRAETKKIEAIVKMPAPNFKVIFRYVSIL